MCGPTTCGLAGVRNIPHRKNISCYVSLQEKPRTQTDNLVRLRKQRDKLDLGVWTGTSWLRIGTGGGHL